jgi:transposase
MQATIIGLDLGKRAFHVVGLTPKGAVVIRQQLRRDQVLSFFAQLNPCTVAIEACASMHYWMREMGRFGHEVRAIHARYVRPYVKTNKNDFNDAQAIAEAASREHMRFVPAKTEEQQTVMHLHRNRELLMRQRNAGINHVRSMLAEYGLILPVGVGAFFRGVAHAMAQLSERAHGLVCNAISVVLEHVRWLNEQLARSDREILQWHRGNVASRRLAEIPGIGPLSATALVASIGDARRFASAREFAASIGLVPRQYSTGGKAKLLGISKHGDRYLRTLLTYGARALVSAHERQKRIGRKSHRPWLSGLLERRHRNTAIVAQAHKNARIAWALLRRETRYGRNAPQAATVGQLAH